MLCKNQKKIYGLENLEVSLFSVIPKEQIFQEIKEGKACLQDTSFDNHLIELCSDKGGFKVTQYPLTKQEQIDGTYSSFNKDFNEAFEEFLCWLKDIKEDVQAEAKQTEEDYENSLFDFLDD